MTIVSHEMIKKVFDFGQKYYPELMPSHNGFCCTSCKDETEAYIKLLKLYLSHNQ